MKAVVKFFVYMGLIIVVLYANGCAHGGESGPQLNADIILAPTKQDHQMPLAGSTAVTTSGAASADAEQRDFNSVTEPDTTTVVLYFAGDHNFLVAEKRAIPKTQGIARQTLIELCQGPWQPGLYATIPLATQLLGIDIEDGLCRVNFSEQLKSHHSGGSCGEMLTIYSIVNTLTQFATIDQVQILLDGQRLDTLAGHLDISMPLGRHSDLIVSPGNIMAEN